MPPTARPGRQKGWMVRRTNTRRWVFGMALVLLGLSANADAARADERSVTVVAVLATDRNDTIDPKVQGIAEEVKKLEPSLTGFRLVRTTNKPVGVGRKESFPLVDAEMLAVQLLQIEPAKDKDKDERIRLAVKAPMTGEITYSTCCGKFFPILTRYLTKDNDRLIVAVMVKPPVKKP